MKHLIEALEQIKNGAEPINEMQMESWISTARSIANEALSIHDVMLSEILEEAENRATEIDDGKSHYSLAHSQGFESGAEWVIERIKEKLHSA